MPLGDLSPNRHGTSSATANSSSGSSSSSSKALLSSALRRSSRLRPSLLPPGMNAEAEAEADDTCDDADGSGVGGAGSGSGSGGSNVNLRLQLEQLRSEAQADRQLLDSIRNVVAAASTTSARGGGGGGGDGDGNNSATISAEEALVELRSLLGVGPNGANGEETRQAGADANVNDNDEDQVMADDGPDLDETIAMDEYYEGTSALDRSDLDIMLGPDLRHRDNEEDSDDNDNDNDSDNEMQPKRQQKIVLDDDDDDDEQDDSFEEDFAPKDENAKKDTTSHTKVQSTPSPDRPFDETPSKCSSHSSSSASAVATAAAPSSTDRLPPPSTKRASIAGSAASSAAKSSSYSMTPDPETDDNEEEEKDLSTSYGNDDSMEGSGAAAAAASTATSASTPQTTKMVYDDGAEEDEYDASSSNRKAKSVKKSDKKKRRKTIALREDSLLRASPSPSTTSAASGTPKVGGGRGTPKSTPSSVSSKSAGGSIAVGDDDKASPPNRKSTGSGGTASVGAGSSATAMSHSTPASNTSGDSYSLAAKAKDSMQKVSVHTASAADGATKVVRRSARRRTLEIQSQTNSLSAMTAPSPASSTMSMMSMPSPAMSDAPPPHMGASRNGGCETPMLPSPAPTDDLGVGSLISRGGLASVQEREGDAADIPAAAVPAALADGDRPPLPPKRTSRRKSVLPERLRQEDVLLDPNLTPNSQMKEMAETQEQQENRASGPIPASIGIELADPDESVAVPKKAAAPSEPQPSAASQPQKKRRRRSSVGGLVAGGLLSAKEIEGLSAYAESKKRSKNSTQQQSSRKRSHEATEATTAEHVANAAAAPSSGAPSEPPAPMEIKPPVEVAEATSAPENDAAPMECDMQQQEAFQAQAAPFEQVDQPVDAAAGKIVKVSVVGEEGTIEALVANEGIPHVELPAPSSPELDTPKQEERILVAAPSPQIQEDDDPLGLKSMIPAPKDDGSALNEPSRPTVIRKTFSFDAEAINARAIKKRIPQLFPDSSTVTQPCASARLFACASIVLESSKADAGGRAKRPSDQLRYVLPTLVAFVNAELVSLSGETPSKADTKRKKLHFSSFDGSTTMPPVDRMSGSHSHLEKNILSLETVFKEVDSLAKKASTGKDDAIVEEIKECLDAIIFTMHHIESDAGANMMNECAESMPFHWPAKRFVKAARTYREELEEVHLLLANKSSNDSALRSRLGDFIGRSIRFYFRRFFDPVPLNLTNDQHENYRHVDLSGTRSRVCEIVEMVDPEGDGRDTAAADGSISSVFSYALRAIHALFAINAERAAVDGEYFSTFFSSGPSQSGLGPGRSPTIVLSDADLDEILADIHDVHIVLQGIKAARFLSALLHWPGVSKAVKDAGGWNKVESFARVFENLDLEKACPEEAYFTLLGGIDRLLQRIDADAEKMAEVERICEDNLRNCWKRFRCGTKSKAILQQNPHISTIAAYLRDGKSLSFPALAEPSEESEEEEE